jgi:hypothetical protein
LIFKNTYKIIKFFLEKYNSKLHNCLDLIEKNMFFYICYFENLTLAHVRMSEGSVIGFSNLSDLNSLTIAPTCQHVGVLWGLLSKIITKFYFLSFNNKKWLSNASWNKQY